MGMPTAFRAEYGDEEGPVIGFMAEYDALCGYGANHDELAHACGHNWIAASTLAAAAALKGTKDYWKGKIVVLGTPAEENFGCKCDMAAAGVFDDLTACFEMHLDTANCVEYAALAMTDFIFEFHGKAAHAEGHPAAGINALDGCNLTVAAQNGTLQVGLVTGQTTATLEPIAKITDGVLMLEGGKIDGLAAAEVVESGIYYEWMEEANILANSLGVTN